MVNDEWFSPDVSLSKYFEKNIQLFARYYPEQAEEVRSSVDRLDAYSFCQIAPGRFACRKQGEEQPFYNPDHFHTYLQQLLNHVVSQYEKRRELGILAGTGLGYIASHVETSMQGKWHTGLLILENRPELVAAQFHLFDCSKLIQSKRVFWCVGTSILSVLEKTFQQFRLDLIPENRMFTVSERWLSREDMPSFQSAGTWITQHWQQTLNRFQTLQQDYQRRMKEPANLEQGRIWALCAPDAYAHTPLIKAMIRGFSELGWETYVLETYDCVSTRYRVAESIYSAAPDVILVCNTASGAYYSNEIQRPRACWILDHPRYYSADTFQKKLIPWDTVFYLDRDYASDLQGTRASVCRFLPAISCISKRGTYREELAAPLVFVGSYQDSSHFMEHIGRQVRDDIEAVTDFMIQHPTHTGQDVIETISIRDETRSVLLKHALKYTESIRDRFPDVNRKIDYFLYMLANSFKRERAVRMLVDHGLVIYGPESWKTLLGDRYADRFRGWIDAGDLADVYASADLVLNIHSLQCPTALNPRDFDVLAAGGCLLTDWVEDLEEGIITPGRDCFSPQRLDDLGALVERVLKDKETREIVREQGHQTYLDHHTPKHRAQEIVTVLQEQFMNNA